MAWAGVRPVGTAIYLVKDIRLTVTLRYEDPMRATCSTLTSRLTRGDFRTGGRTPFRKRPADFPCRGSHLVNGAAALVNYSAWACNMGCGDAGRFFLIT